MTETRQDIFRLSEDLYRLVQTDSNGTFVDAYLIVGSESALVIDLQRAEGCLLETVRQITDKPFSVVITHAHYDHLGANTAAFVKEGIPIWMFREEYDLCREQIDAAFGCSAEDRFLWLHEGQNFDLGGYILEIGSLTGHTPRGAMLLERSRGWLFSGDAFGNKSFFMHIPTSTGLDRLAADLKRFLPTVRDIPQLQIFTGHGIAETFYGIEWAEAIATLTDEILNGIVQGYPSTTRFGDCLRVDTELYPDGYLYKQ